MALSLLELTVGDFSKVALRSQFGELADDYARISVITLPCTSVNRKSRPAYR